MIAREETGIESRAPGARASDPRTATEALHRGEDPSHEARHRSPSVLGVMVSVRRITVILARSVTLVRSGMVSARLTAVTLVRSVMVSARRTAVILVSSVMVSARRTAVIRVRLVMVNGLLTTVIRDHNVMVSARRTAVILVRSVMVSVRRTAVILVRSGTVSVLRTTATHVRLVTERGRLLGARATGTSALSVSTTIHRPRPEIA